MTSYIHWYSHSLTKIVWIGFFFYCTMAVAVANEKPLATVNGVDITQEQLEAHRQHLVATRVIPNNPKKFHSIILNDLIERELVWQKIQKSGAPRDQYPRATLINDYIETYIADHVLADRELENEYDVLKVAKWPTEYRLREIVLNTEQEAQSTIKRLDKGSHFSVLAREKSKASSAKAGGDRGRLKLSQIDPALSKEVQRLSRNEYTRKPVKVNENWYLLYVENIHLPQYPPFDEIKNSVREYVSRLRYQEHAQYLRNEAEVVIHDKGFLQ